MQKTEGRRQKTEPEDGREKRRYCNSLLIFLLAVGQRGSEMTDSKYTKKGKMFELKSPSGVF